MSQPPLVRTLLKGFLTVTALSASLAVIYLLPSINNLRAPEIMKSFSSMVMMTEEITIEPVDNLKKYAGDDIFNPERFPFTDYNRSLTKTRKDFWLAHLPSFKCPFSSLNRVGKNHDGGKWLCGLRNLGLRTINGHNCVIYSFGVAGDSSFEAEVLQSTGCQAFAYDLSDDKIGVPLKPSNPRLHYKKLGVSGRNSELERVKTLKTIMNENGHTFADILKIDIEGAEYEVFEKFLEDFEELPFGQLMVEFHMPMLWTLEDKLRTVNIFQRLEEKGARLFSVEPNEYYPNSCCEYSFINLKTLKLFVTDM